MAREREDRREHQIERPVKSQAAAVKTPKPEPVKEPTPKPRPAPTIKPEQQVVDSRATGKPGASPGQEAFKQGPGGPPIPPARAMPSPPPGKAGEQGKTRAQQGDIQRPVVGGQMPQDVSGKAATSPANASPAASPPTAPGGQTASVAPVQPLPPPPPINVSEGAAAIAQSGQPVANRGANVAQGMVGQGPPLNPSGLPMTAQEQTSQLTQDRMVMNGDTSGILSGMQAAQDQELMRMSQPSPVKGVPQGTYEKVVKDDYTQDFKSKQPLSPAQNARVQENVKAQLEAYGDYPGKGDPKAPPPPIRPGGRSFNPFTGKFSGENGPNSFTLMGIDMEALKQEYYSKNGGG